jgi:hypothetical protein
MSDRMAASCQVQPVAGKVDGWPLVVNFCEVLWRADRVRPRVRHATSNYQHLRFKKIGVKRLFDSRHD